MLASCPLCGTQTSPGTVCPNCGTPTPADLRPSAAPAAEHAPSSASLRQANQWEVLFDKVRRAAAPKYQVQSILGFGGMAGVYLALEPRLGRKVAIKVMSPALMVDPKLVDRFVQEARTIAALSHPNIVTIYEVEERDELHWFAMTYVAGRTLAQVMAEATEPLPMTVVRAWLYQIGDALAYAHHHGIVHRDIKPGNVLLDPRGNALVTDFGIAKVADAEVGLTRTGMLVGTPAYMSPEQCSSGRVSGASDQYSLGAVAYQMITGQPPFAGPTLSVLQAHVSQEPQAIRELRPDCPDDLLGAVQRMLEKRVEDRWPSLSAAIAAANATPPGLDGPVREQLELLAAPAAGMTVARWDDTLREGSQREIQVLIVDAGGRVLRGRRVEWNSLDPVVAGVAGASTLRAFAPGTTQLKATSGQASLTLSLTVESDPIRDIEIDPAEVTLPIGSQMKLEAIVHDWDGDRLEDRAVLWSSSNSGVASVDFDGHIDGITRGTAVISASTGGKSAAANITVSEAARTARRAAPAPRATLHPPPKPSPPAKAEPVTAPPSGVPKEPSPVSVPVESRPQRGLWMVAAGIVAIVAAVLGVTRPWQRSPTSVTDPATSVTGPQLAGSDSVSPPVVSPTATSAASPESAQAVTPPPPAANRDSGRVAAPPVQRAESARVETRQTPVRPPPEQPPPVVIRGTVEVTASNLPAGSSITMRDASGQISAVTVRSLSLEPGEYVFEFRASGYETDQRTIRVQSGQTHRYQPDIRALPSREPPAQPPPRNTQADRAAIEAAVGDFIAAFQRRDASTVVPLLPSEQRTNWRTLLENRSVSDWQAALGTMEAPRFDGDAATIAFTVRVSFRSMNQNPRQELRYTGSLERNGSAWKLTSLRTN